VQSSELEHTLVNVSGGYNGTLNGDTVENKRHY
jgi:hypothetical protein